MISVISWRGEELAAYATEMTQWFEERGIAGVEEHSPFDYRFRYLVLPNVGLEFVLRFRNDDFREFLPSAEVLKVQKISFEPWVIRIRSE